MKFDADYDRENSGCGGEVFMYILDYLKRCWFV